MFEQVTVLVPTFNRARFLGECLDALLAQSVAPSEIIVVDDGSTDGTDGVVARRNIPGLRYVRQENLGKSAALNRGLREARGEYIWIMDDDDVALPDALERHLNALRSDPGAAFTWSGFQEAHDEGGKLVFDNQYGAFNCRAKRLFVGLLCDGEEPSTGFMYQQGMVVRRRCFDVVGGFDENLLRCMDLEMNLRLCRSFRGRRIEVPTFILRQHQGVRGPEFDRHDREAREEKWAFYGLKILRELHASLPLREYLDEPEYSDLPPDWEERAIVNRIWMNSGRQLGAIEWVAAGTRDLILADLEELVRSGRRGERAIAWFTVEDLARLERRLNDKGMRDLAERVQEAVWRLVDAAGNRRALALRLLRHVYWGEAAVRGGRWSRLETFRRTAERVGARGVVTLARAGVWGVWR